LRGKSEKCQKASRIIWMALLYVRRNVQLLEELNLNGKWKDKVCGQVSGCHKCLFTFVLDCWNIFELREIVCVRERERWRCVWCVKERERERDHPWSLKCCVQSKLHRQIYWKNFIKRYCVCLSSLHSCKIDRNLIEW